MFITCLRVLCLFPVVNRNFKLLNYLDSLVSTLLIINNVFMPNYCVRGYLFPSNNLLP